MRRQRREIPWLQVRDGTYYVYWYDPSAASRTKRHSLQTKDAVEAQSRYADFLTKDRVLFDESRRTAQLTVSHALDDYFREHVATKVVDKARQETAIEHLKTWFKTTPLADVDIPASRAYAAARRIGAIGGGKRRKTVESRIGSDSTIRRELVVLQAAANHALRWKRVTAAQMPSVELPAEAPQEEIWLTQAEMARVISAATGRLRAFIEVAYYTAARRASIERLTKFQVDLAQGRINLTAPTEDANQRRSKKRRPVVPIDPKLRPTIERLMTEAEANKTSWLFGNPPKNRKNTTTSDDHKEPPPPDMYRAFRNHLDSLGLSSKAFPHVLRHSRATHLLQSGVSLWDVAKLLGDTVATVERVYGHHSPDYLARALSSQS